MPGATAKGYPYPLGTDLVSSGDDTIKALAQFLDGTASTRAGGTVTVNTTALNVPVSTSVTFPAGRFTAAPQVITTARVSNPQTATTAANNATATGVVIWGARTSAGNLNPFDIDWVAIQS